MDNVKVYSNEGTLVGCVPLSTNISALPNSRRVWIGDNGLYYKGAGISYQFHHVRNMHEGLELLSENNEVVYGGYTVRDPRYEGLTGIICERYQPYFRDYIGGCGPKESSLLFNSKEFELSGVEVLDIYDVIDDHKIYVCNYKAKNGLESEPPSIHRILAFLDYVLSTDWCCPWDKDTYRDIDGLGYLRDPADWFRSSRFEDKLGTVYSILYPLFVRDNLMYCTLLSSLNLPIPPTLFTLPLICLYFMRRKNNYIPEELRGRYDEHLYYKLITEYLFNARYCCQIDVEDEYYFNVKDLMLRKFHRDIGGKV